MQFLRSATNTLLGVSDESTPIDEGEGVGLPLPPLPRSIKPGFTLQLEEEGVEGSCGTWWHSTSGPPFDLRVGPNYAKHKNKEPAGPPLMELMAVDLIRSDKRIDNIGQYFDFPKEWLEDGDGGGDGEMPSIFIVNVQIPTEGLGGGVITFFSDIDDGEGLSLVFFYRVRADTAAGLKDGGTPAPAAKLLNAFCKEAPVSEMDTCDAWKGRFKVIVSIKDVESYGLPGFITSYNAKPVLIRTTGTVYKGENYTEQDVNCHAFGAVARKALGVLSGKFPSMCFNIGYIIESRTDDEMPETLLGSGMLNQPNKEVAPHWSMFSSREEGESEK